MGLDFMPRGDNLIQRGDNLIQRGDNLKRGDMIFSLGNIVAATVGEIPTVSQNFRIHEPEFLVTQFD